MSKEEGPMDQEVTSPAKGSSVEDELSSRVGFTSENFKIELKGLPKFFGIGQIKKLFLKNKLTFHKLKPVGKGATYMFVNFKNEDEREKAISVLDGMTIRGRKVKAFKANAAKDPMLKLKSEEAGKEKEEDTRPVLDRIRSAVCPLAGIDYEEQLKVKVEQVETLMNSLRKEVMQQLGKLVKDLKEEEVAVMEPILRSPVTDGYRNKCEFSVGRHPETDEVTVGFRLASYRKGSTAVVGLEGLPNVSNEVRGGWWIICVDLNDNFYTTPLQMRAVATHFESFVRSSGYEPFNNISQKGHWKQLTVRTSNNGGEDNVMAWAILDPQNLAEEEKTSLRERFQSHFSGCPVRVTSLHLQFFTRKEKGGPRTNDSLKICLQMSEPCCFTTQCIHSCVVHTKATPDLTLPSHRGQTRTERARFTTRPTLSSIINMERLQTSVLFLMALISSEVEGCKDLLQKVNNGSLVEKPPQSPLKVDFSYRIRETNGVRESEGEISLNLIVLVEWKDPRINCSHTTGKVPAQVMDKMWKPDLFFFKSEGVRIMRFVRDAPERLLVLREGRVLWWFSLAASQSCEMDYSSFPFDIQHCLFRITSIDDSIEEQMYSTRFILKQDDHSDFLNYKVTYHELTKEEKREFWRFQNVLKPITGFSIRLERKIYPIFLNIFLPTFTIVLVSMVGFFIPPEAIPGRIGLLVTAFLVLVSLASTHTFYSPGHNVFTALDFWIISCEVFLSVEIFQYAVLLRMMRRSKIKSGGRGSSSSSSSSRNMPSKSMHRLCTKIDRICFWIVLVTYLLFCAVYGVWNVKF